ncbi:hypothetical protein AB1I63_06415 [Streptococcus pneumoniae]
MKTNTKYILSLSSALLILLVIRLAFANWQLEQLLNWKVIVQLLITLLFLVPVFYMKSNKEK